MNEEKNLDNTPYIVKTSFDDIHLLKQYKFTEDVIEDLYLTVRDMEDTNKIKVEMIKKMSDLHNEYIKVLKRTEK